MRKNIIWKVGNESEPAIALQTYSEDFCEVGRFSAFVVISLLSLGYNVAFGLTFNKDLPTV